MARTAGALASPTECRRNEDEPVAEGARTGPGGWCKIVDPELFDNTGDPSSSLMKAVKSDDERANVSSLGLRPTR